MKENLFDLSMILTSSGQCSFSPDPLSKYLITESRSTSSISSSLSLASPAVAAFFLSSTCSRISLKKHSTRLKIKVLTRPNPYSWTVLLLIYSSHSSPIYSSPPASFRLPPLLTISMAKTGDWRVRAEQSSSNLKFQISMKSLKLLKNCQTQSRRSKVSPLEIKSYFNSGFQGKFSAPRSYGNSLINLSSIGYLIDYFSTRSGWNCWKTLNQNLISLYLASLAFSASDFSSAFL